MAASLKKRGDELALSLAGMGDGFGDALTRVKAIPGRRYNAADKTWRFPATPMAANQVIAACSPQLDKAAREWMREAVRTGSDDLVVALPEAATLRASAPERLMPHQRPAVEAIAQWGRTILSDDMGLGKTVEALVGVEEWWIRRLGKPPERPMLVVAPTSILGSWERHVRDWTNLEPRVIAGRMAAPRRHQALQAAIAAGGVVIVGWEQVRAVRTKLTLAERRKARRAYEWRLKEPLFAETEWAAVIADEAHRAKNRHAQQTRGLWQIAAPVQIAATGTPILNSPDEIWALMRWLWPDEYGEHHPHRMGWQRFFDAYVDYYEGQYGRIITGVKNADELRFALRGRLIRRTKGMVLDLPPKVIDRVPVEMTPTQRKLYREAEVGLWVEIEQAAKADPAVMAAVEDGDLAKLALLIPNAAARITRLRQILSSPALLGGKDSSGKLDAAVEMVLDAGEPAVIFTNYRGTCDLLADRLGKRKLRVGLIHGGIDPATRTITAAAFQEGGLDVLVGTIPAMGLGLTLTAASFALFVERDWTPDVNRQAEDRLHRIGQSDTVLVRVLECPGTVDTKNVRPANAKKDRIIQAVLPADPTQESQ